jgi:hypothetical protein
MKGMPHAARLFLAILWAGSSVSPVWGGATPAPHETIEWTWAEFPKSIDPALPDVLLEGDSITRNYYPEVAAELSGKANIFLFATSASVGDPRLSKQLADYSELARRHFNVIHFSNGLHGWDITEDRMDAVSRPISAQFSGSRRRLASSGRRPRQSGSTRTAEATCGLQRATPLPND